ncbi:ArsR family transcriptional regulator [Methanococcus voltae]|uniref:ArsR family transcriptional regulator n=1 Tax=Methanococcus voltae TaxID=2188 RepID=UPI001AE86341|nr:ArsR family transcriptional regulator [Methanococcus voltae]MBP2173071.1 DNA-binding HxlR family transcriptional regulator [Methanococcus voltae]
MLLKILTKKSVKEILYLINDNEEMYWGQIQELLGVDGSNLSKVLSLLVKNGILSKRRILKGDSMPYSYFKLTKKGKTALKLYEIGELLDDNQDIKIAVSNADDDDLSDNKNSSISNSYNNVGTESIIVTNSKNINVKK